MQAINAYTFPVIGYTGGTTDRGEKDLDRSRMFLNSKKVYPHEQISTVFTTQEKP